MESQQKASDRSGKPMQTVGLSKSSQSSPPAGGDNISRFRVCCFSAGLFYVLIFKNCHIAHKKRANIV